MRITLDDNWGPDAKEILYSIEGVKRVLVASLDKRYSRSDCEQYDLIASCTTGTDHIDPGEVPLLCLQGETEFLRDVYATAEHTIALMLALVRKIPAAHNDVCAGNWNREAWQGSELHGKNVGIIGCGRVGNQVSKFVEAFGMEILGVDIGEDWEDLLNKADIITMHIPLDNNTIGLLGKEQFIKMKPTSLFINTSRGPIVDEEALVWALENKIIAGGALDVVQNEPCVNPRLLDYAKTHDNLILSPHIAGNTVESRKKCQLFIANRIVDFINKQNMV